MQPKTNIITLCPAVCKSLDQLVFSRKRTIVVFLNTGQSSDLPNIFRFIAKTPCCSMAPKGPLESRENRWPEVKFARIVNKLGLLK